MTHGPVGVAPDLVRNHLLGFGGHPGALLPRVAHVDGLDPHLPEPPQDMIRQDRARRQEGTPFGEDGAAQDHTRTGMLEQKQPHHRAPSSPGPSPARTAAGTLLSLVSPGETPGFFLLL